MKTRRYGKLLKLISLFLSTLVFLFPVFSINGLTLLILDDFSDFIQISDSSNFHSNNNNASLSFSLNDNSTIDSISEFYRFNLTKNYYDFNFSIEFDCNRDKPFDVKFGVVLESEYDENGTYLNGDYNRICCISLIGDSSAYLDLVYRVEFYPNGVYTKTQSSTFIFYFSAIKFLFSRTNGTINCLIKDQFGLDYFDKLTANINYGVNRSLDSIGLELKMNTLQCNPFTISVNSIEGELYGYIREGFWTPPSSTSPSEISLDLSGFSIIAIFISLIIITNITKIKLKQNNQRKKHKNSIFNHMLKD
jgi:hypothetical protein